MSCETLRPTKSCCRSGHTSESRMARWIVKGMAYVAGVTIYLIPSPVVAGGPSAQAEQSCPPGTSDSAVAAPRPQLRQRMLPIDISKEVVFKVSKLECPLVEGVGCGHLLAPSLAQMDGIEGVMRSYTNWTGSELRVTIAPKADVGAVAERVRAFLMADEQAPVRVDGDALARSLKENEWRGVEQVVELTTYEYHTFARRQIGAFADEQKFDAAKKEKLLALVDAAWEKAARGLGDPAPDADAYASYWQTRIDKLVQMFTMDSKDLLTQPQIEELLKKYGRRTK